MPLVVVVIDPLGDRFLCPHDVLDCSDQRPVGAWGGPYGKEMYSVYREMFPRWLGLVR